MSELRKILAHWKVEKGEEFSARFFILDDFINAAIGRMKINSQIRWKFNERSE